MCYIHLHICMARYKCHYQNLTVGSVFYVATYIVISRVISRVNNMVLLTLGYMYSLKHCRQFV